MPIVTPLTPPPNEVVPDRTLRFDYPGSDIILRSRDDHDFRVPQLYLVTSSPVLQKLIQLVLSTPGVANKREDCEEQEPLPVINLSESGAILYSLLTFIFPVAPALPSTTESIMKLLSLAQRYQINSVLTHIRGAISRRDPPFILPETALHVYFFAQKYELHQEALSAARVTLRLPMTIEDLEDKVNFMPGAYLRELWKYHEEVRKELVSSLLEFRKTGVPDTVKDLRCAIPQPSTLPIPQWLDNYIDSIAQAPHLFDLIEFEGALARHIKSQPPHSAACPCVGLSSQAIRTFWEALTAVVHRAIEKADLTLTLVGEGRTSENWGPPSLTSRLDIPDANIILRSSDQVSFRVHKSVLSTSSPFFKDMLSLPQPPDDELVDGLPVIQLSEDADLLSSLVSLLYPISTVILAPSSYEKVFALLAACQKYDMAPVQSYIRSQVKLGTFPGPVGVEVFSAYAIASSKGLDPEMENAARLTLEYPMTFEFIGEELESFEGRALCDLIRYRKRCRDNLVTCLNSFFNVHSRFQIWAGCREPYNAPRGVSVSVLVQDAPTVWLRNFFTSKSAELQNGFTHAISSPSIILKEYLAALKNHNSQYCCNSCTRVHVMEGEKFGTELENESALALDEVKVRVLGWGVRKVKRSGVAVGVRRQAVAV